MQVTDAMLSAARTAYWEREFTDIDPMRAALTAALAEMWRPIEDAPKDGTPVLLLLEKPIHSNDLDSYVPFKEIQSVIGWWGNHGWEISFMEEGTADSFGYCSNFYMGVINQLPSPPTHFMSLPAPPMGEVTPGLW